MKIFLVTPQYLGTITGSGGLYVLELSRELSLLKHDVEVLTPLVGNQKEEETISLEACCCASPRQSGKVTVRRFPIPDSRLIRNPFEGSKDTEIKRLDVFKEKVIQYLSRNANKKSIVHLNGHFSIPGMARDLKKFPRLKIVTSIHSLESISEAKKEENSISKFLLHYIQEKEKDALLYSDCVIFWSQALKDEIAWMYPDIIKQARINVIPFGIPRHFTEDEFLAPEKVILIKEKYKITDRFLLYLGRIDPTKGLEYLIHSFPPLIRRLKAALGQQYQPYSLLIAGLLEFKNAMYAEKLQKIKNQIKDEEIRDSIHIVPDSSVIIDKEYLYRLASVFTLPIIVSPFGLSLIEAIIKKTPFVASGVEGILEILNLPKINAPFIPVKGGVVVDFHNPMNRMENYTEALYHAVLHHDKLKKSILSLRQRTLEKYSWKKLINRIIAIYKGLMKEHQ
ncbi:MAG: glycosyltransferase family 4 protein [bacterium]|nr:glycosyltransferase family 4 protein [bacterium]